MNKIYMTIATSGLLLLGVSSCNMDSYKPSDSLPDNEAITTVRLFDSAVKGVYQPLVENPFGLDGQGGLYADAKGGDCKWIGKSNNFRHVLYFLNDMNSSIANDTYYLYADCLGLVNSALKNSENVEDKDAGDAKKAQYNNLLGECYALRGFLHFEMARVFAQLPTVATDMNAANSGIFINDKYISEVEPTPRATLKATYDFILQDFEKALTLISKDPTPDHARFNYWTVRGLMARVYLYLGDYQKAYDTAKSLIDAQGEAHLRLFAIDEYLASWSQKGTVESLAEIAATDKSSAQRNALGYQTNPEGYAECAASDAFMDFVNTKLDPNDIRKQTITKRFEPDDKGNKNQEGFYSTKYMGQTGVAEPLYINNFKVMRMSEVYLIASEAALKLGNSTDALKYYNELRQNRIRDYQPATSVTIDNLLDERRIELYCENHRMFDLVRNHLDISTPYTPEKVVKYNDYRVVCAIPLREIDINKGALVQNPGYKK